MGKNDDWNKAIWKHMATFVSIIIWNFISTVVLYKNLLSNPNFMTRQESYYNFACLLKWMLISILFLIPAGAIYQMRLNAIFMANCDSGYCGSYLPILLMVLMVAEIYLLGIGGWFFALKEVKKPSIWTVFQMFLIFIAGVIPGLYLTYWAWTA